ncbi:MAG: DUF1659 domain-containing protein [Sporolactobacillus sp.]
MATSSITASTLNLNLDGGMNEAGKAIVITKSFRNIQSAAPYDALLAIAQKLQPLQQHALISVERNDTVEISA